MSPAHRHLLPRPIAAIRLDGGLLCLDFVNSIHNRYADEIEDYLHHPERFIDWCVRAGALGSDERVSLPRGADKREALMLEVVTLPPEGSGVDVRARIFNAGNAVGEFGQSVPGIAKE